MFGGDRLHLQDLFITPLKIFSSILFCRINYQSKPSEIEEEKEKRRSDGEDEDEDLVGEDMEEEDMEYIRSVGGKSAFLSNLEDR